MAGSHYFNGQGTPSPNRKCIEFALFEQEKLERKDYWSVNFLK
jgi:hypothetical protein